MYMSDSVGIAELRQNLSKYLKLVADGERLTVTDHNRPVAVLGPVPARERSEKLQRLIDEGKVRPAKNPTGTFPPPLDFELPPGMSSEQIFEELREEDDHGSSDDS
jgi:prevent-host-death family protein